MDFALDLMLIVVFGACLVARTARRRREDRALADWLAQEERRSDEFSGSLDSKLLRDRSDHKATSDPSE